MLKLLKKFPAAGILVLIFFLSSCADNRIAFSPESGSYEILLEENAWTVAGARHMWELQLTRTDKSLTVMINYYRKEAVAEAGASDLNGFIRFFRTLGIVSGLYDDPSSQVHDLVDMAPRDMRGSPAISGKRQRITSLNPQIDAAAEIIFLEMDDFYFAITYHAKASEFRAAQSIINDLVRNLRMKV